MNKQFFVVLVLFAMASSSFAQIYSRGSEAGFGVRASGGLNGLTGDYGKDSDMGFHVGAGAFALNSLGPVTLNIGANLVYKEIASYEEKTLNIEWSITELSLDIPALLRLALPVNEQVYVELGPQFNIAFSPEREFNGQAQDIDNRSSFDIGLTIGAGYSITEELSADVRYTYGLSNYLDGEGTTHKDGALYHITFGVNYML